MAHGITLMRITPAITPGDITHNIIIAAFGGLTVLDAVGPVAQSPGNARELSEQVALAEFIASLPPQRERSKGRGLGVLPSVE